ncbi:Flp family type IVb pilin [Qipengyuania sp. 1NDW9]|uniref:Flp family type IVb pilin n=1 Tax=Qipengyuania aquimaris TaxID=255984 RepID=A0A9Q3XDA3_9SPHN|nr:MULTISPECIES: Flp family type IVb pilin [Qipengyuania]MBX7493282.1 Flp family type IVb pilin [Qipengyuania xiapuensis]MBY6128908.1 Flp family type IVb pilin [Qipengyuania aquimaris]MBY6217556.1 Flp family type IVb pilin [Qipengyuania aquimaris]UOR14684.1 Flp family type IVb pilin [Qipengyuania aquimaris]
MNAIKRFLEDDKGATAIEYGLIVALIAVTAIAAMQTLGNEFGATLDTVSTTMSTANV